MRGVCHAAKESVATTSNAERFLEDLDDENRVSVDDGEAVRQELQVVQSEIGSSTGRFLRGFLSRARLERQLEQIDVAKVVDEQKVARFSKDRSNYEKLDVQRPEQQQGERGDSSSTEKLKNHQFIFESSLELMSSTKVGGFQMAPGGQKSGPPPAVKKVLNLFGSGKEEDKLVGYLSFLKIGPKLLKYLPGKKVQDLRNWLTVYSYWNQGGEENVTSMINYILRECFELPSAPPEPRALLETPATGCLHPEAPGRYFESPDAYMQWYEKHGPLKNTSSPRAAVLLYRKHVITKQPYINDIMNAWKKRASSNPNLYQWC
eukprot:jgi/Picre1/35227/NNA_002689.t1